MHCVRAMANTTNPTNPNPSETALTIVVPRATIREDGVRVVMNEDDTIRVIVPQVLNQSQARRAVTLETNTHRSIIGAASELAESLQEGAGAQASEEAADAASQVRDLWGTEGRPSILDNEGRIRRDVLDATVAMARARADEAGKDPDAAGWRAEQAALRKAATIERAATTYAAAKATAVCLVAATDAVKEGRLSRRKARSERRPMTEGEQAAVDRGHAGRKAKGHLGGKA